MRLDFGSTRPRPATLTTTNKNIKIRNIIGVCVKKKKFLDRYVILKKNIYGSRLFVSLCSVKQNLQAALLVV